MGDHTTLTDLTVRYIEEIIKTHVCEWECKAANAEHTTDQTTFKTMATAASVLLHAVQIAEVEALLHHANGRPLRTAQFKEVELPHLPKRPYSKGQVVDVESAAVGNA